MVDVSNSARLDLKHEPSHQPARWVMLSVMLGTGTVSLSNSSFNPALATLMQQFALSEAQVSWVMVIFLMSMSLSLLLAGYLSQTLGKRNVYLMALLTFVAISAVGMLAQSFNTVLLVRAIQGFASGLMIPLSLGLIFAVTPQSERGAATGIWGAMIMLTLACGPMLGALLLLKWGWPALFSVNLPFGLIALLVGYKTLPKQPQCGVSAFDWQGFSTLSISIVALLLALSQIKTRADFWAPAFYLPLLLAILMGGLFQWLPAKRKAVLIPAQLFASQGFNFSLIISVLHTVGLFIMLFAIPLLVQNALHLSPLWTGALLMSSALCTSVCSKWAGNCLDRFGAKCLISIGLLLTSSAFIGLGAGIHLPVTFLMLCMMVHGLGFAMSYMPSTTAGLNSLNNQELVTQGAAINNLLRRLCSAVAVVLAALYLQFRSASLLSLHDPQWAQLIAIRELFLICAGGLLLALPFAWKFPDIKNSSACKASM